MSEPYNVGTVSVLNGGTTVTGVETYWIGAVFKNDMLMDPASGLQARVTEDPTSNTELTINPWPGSSLTDAAYEIIPAADTTTSSARLRDLLAQMSVVQANGQGVFYKFSDTTTDADPGAGYFRFNNADPALATAIYIDNLNANGGAMGDIIDKWDDSTSLVKGVLIAQGVTDKTIIRAYSITGSVVDGTGYRKLTGTYDGGSGSLAADDEFMLAFVRTGDQGDSFARDAEVAGPSELTAYESEDEGFLVFVTDLETDFGAFSGRSGVVKLIAGPDWQLVALYTGPKGDQGEKGAQWESAWVTATFYAVDDITREDGSAYICLEPHTSGTFSTDLAAGKWELFVEKGGTGATGAPGGGLKGIACRVVATANVAIATELEAADTIDGVTLSSGDLVLLTAQTDPKDNGVYIASVSGAATRHTDFDAWDDFPGSYFPVNEGTANADTLWRCTSNAGGTLGTTPLVFEEFTSGVGGASAPQGRLTLSSVAAVSDSDVTGAGTIYYLPSGGALVPIRDGGKYVAESIGSGLSLVLDSDSGHTGYHQSARCFDLFAIKDGSTVRLATGPDWNAGAIAGSITQRGTGAGSTELELVDGLYVNKNAITARFGSASGNTVAVAAHEATYLGTFYAAGNGLATDSAEKRWLDNAFNQTMRPMRRFQVSPGNWSYSTATFRQANANADNRISWVAGLSGKSIDANLQGLAQTSGATRRAVVVALGIDSTTTPAADSTFDYMTCVSPELCPIKARYVGTPGIGFHALNWLERGAGTDTQTFFADSGATPSIYRLGIIGSALF